MERASVSQTWQYDISAGSATPCSRSSRGLGPNDRLAPVGRWALSRAGDAGLHGVPSFAGNEPDRWCNVPARSPPDKREDTMTAGGVFWEVSGQPVKSFNFLIHKHF